MDLLRIAARVAAGQDYLAFTSASGAAVWELGPGADVQKLRPLVDAYNTTAAWTARGGDATAYLLDERGLVRELGEPGGTVDDLKPVDLGDEGMGGVESWSPADMQKAVDMLTGKLDGLTGEPV